MKYSRDKIENAFIIMGTSIYSFESVIILRSTRLFFICLIYLTLACEVIESLPLRGNL